MLLVLSMNVAILWNEIWWYIHKGFVLHNNFPTHTSAKTTEQPPQLFISTWITEEFSEKADLISGLKFKLKNIALEHQVEMYGEAGADKCELQVSRKPRKSKEFSCKKLH